MAAAELDVPVQGDCQALHRRIENGIGYDFDPKIQGGIHVLLQAGRARPGMTTAGTAKSAAACPTWAILAALRLRSISAPASNPVREQIRADGIDAHRKICSLFSHCKSRSNLFRPGVQGQAQVDHIRAFLLVVANPPCQLSWGQAGGIHHLGQDLHPRASADLDPAYLQEGLGLRLQHLYVPESPHLPQ